MVITCLKKNWKFDGYQGNVRELTKSEGSVGKILVVENCLLLTLGLHQC